MVAGRFRWVSVMGEVSGAAGELTHQPHRVGRCPQTATRVSFHAELDSLLSALAVITRLAARMMATASAALHHADLRLAESLISGDRELKVRCEELDQRCLNLLLVQAPVATDLRVVLTAMRAAGDLERMASLAQHIAKITRLKHPTMLILHDVRPVFARMSTLAVNLAQDAATAIESRDPLSGERLAQADHEVDELRRQLFPILFSEDWSHGVEPAVDAALIGRYYERFADHAVAIARQVNFLVTGLSPQR